MTFEHAVKIGPGAVGGVHYSPLRAGQCQDVSDPRGLARPGGRDQTFEGDLMHHIVGARPRFSEPVMRP